MEFGRLRNPCLKLNIPSRRQRLFAPFPSVLGILAKRNQIDNDNLWNAENQTPATIAGGDAALSSCHD
jgi:hypothetical protein